MIKKLLILSLILLLFLVAPIQAANTVTYTNHFIEITPDGTTDWDSTTKFSAGINLISIEFKASAANDILVIHSSSATGACIFNQKELNGGGLIKYFDGDRAMPYLKASDCTFGTAANVRIILHYQ